MDLEKFIERSNLDDRVLKECRDRFPDIYQSIRSFDTDALMHIDNKDDSYYEALKAFKALFSLGGEAHVYLWNNMYSYYKESSELGSIFDENDYSTEEAIFVKSMSESYSRTVSKYGESFDESLNINTKRETKRLFLCPYDDELSEKYLDFFEENQEEYERYYCMPYNVTCSKFYNGQKDHPLAFAIISKEADEFIGSVALHLIRSGCVYNIEYYIIPEFRRRGYAEEAVSALIDAAKNKKLYILQETIKDGVYEEVPADIKCIEAKIHIDNTASIELVKKLSFELMGKELYHRKLRDTYFDAEVYDLEL